MNVSFSKMSLMIDAKEDSTKGKCDVKSEESMKLPGRQAHTHLNASDFIMFCFTPDHYYFYSI